MWPTVPPISRCTEPNVWSIHFATRHCGYPNTSLLVKPNPPRRRMHCGYPNTSIVEAPRGGPSGNSKSAIPSEVIHPSHPHDSIRDRGGVQLRSLLVLRTSIRRMKTTTTISISHLWYLPDYDKVIIHQGLETRLGGRA